METRTYPCFCCGKPLKNGNGKTVYQEDDGQGEHLVGSDCYKKVLASLDAGYPQGGKDPFVRMFVTKEFAQQYRRCSYAS